jgi:hypothetical protein
MLVVQDGPEAVFEYGVTFHQTGEPLEWLRDCQIIKDSSPCFHS